MKKRIFFSMVLLTITSLVFTSAALCFVFYNQFSTNLRYELREMAELYRNGNESMSIEELDFPDVRITLIAPDGSVLYDNVTGTSGENEILNHSDRTEVQAALKSDYGESRRLSRTTGREAYYCAVLLENGNIFRVSKTISSGVGFFTEASPAVVLAVLISAVICYLVAGRLTRRIIEPINVSAAGELTAPYDELTHFITTIAEQRERIARQLSDLQSRSDTINAIMDNMKEGIILLDKKGIIISANKSVLRAFDKSESMDGKNILEFSRDMSFWECVRNALAGSSGEISMEHSGAIHRVYFSPVSDSGAIILFLEITEKARAEKIRQEFSANVSHELKTPLTSIYGNAEMLCSGIVKESDKSEFYRKIKDEAGRLIVLIEDIIKISELDEDGVQKHFEELDPAVLANQVVDSLMKLAEENNIFMEITGVAATIKADSSMIYEMFYNLIENAIKYNKPGGRINVGFKHNGRWLKITVSDTGIGIPAEAQSRVFERFYRIDKSRSRKTGGTGLGLAIVKHVVLFHGGRITLRSTLGTGTDVTVYFPVV